MAFNIKKKVEEIVVKPIVEEVLAIQTKENIIPSVGFSMIRVGDKFNVVQIDFIPETKTLTNLKVAGEYTDRDEAFEAFKIIVADQYFLN